MKVLFLDIDGVCNNSRTTARFDGFIGLDPFMCLLVDRIIQATGCKVVLSSSWRHEPHSVAKIKSDVCELYGMTPVIGGLRGEEIKQWLDSYHYTVKLSVPTGAATIEYQPEVTRYAILDDNSDMLPEQMGNFFKTTWEVGLTEEIANKVIEYLNYEEKPSESKV